MGQGDMQVRHAGWWSGIGGQAGLGERGRSGRELQDVGQCHKLCVGGVAAFHLVSSGPIWISVVLFY